LPHFSLKKILTATMASLIIKVPPRASKKSGGSRLAGDTPRGIGRLAIPTLDPLSQGN
jgi:hypothetical protein